MDTSPIRMHVPKKGTSPRRMAQMAVNTTLFFAIAAIAIPSCLGYRFNWQARTIQQTGLIELSGPQQSLEFDIYVNGVLQEATLPFRMNWVFPGSYSLRVEREGYQSWEKTVRVEKNRRESYGSVLLIFNQPRPAEVPKGLTVADLPSKREPDSRIEVRSGNELRVNGEYETSTSSDIIDARWFPGKNHVVYQAGKELVLYDVKTDTTQKLLSLSSSEQLRYTFEEGGRVLVYVEDDTLKAVSLFEEVSFIDRLGVGH